MTLQIYNKIKYVHNGLLSVELDYGENYEVGDIYHFNKDYQCKGIVKRVTSCPNYKDNGRTFIIVELI